jgi:hypothetical protein
VQPQHRQIWPRFVYGAVALHCIACGSIIVQLALAVCDEIDKTDLLSKLQHKMNSF